MGLKLHYILAVFCVAIVGGEAVLTSEKYWNEALPTTPIPFALKLLIQPLPAWATQKTTFGTHAKPVPFRGYRQAAHLHDTSVSDAAVLFLTYKHDSPGSAAAAAFLFTEKDLKTGKQVTLQFPLISANEAPFLPRHVAESIPFSSDKFPEILNALSLDSKSDEASDVKKTIDACEDASMKGEEKFCATSLESMVDFSKSQLGQEIEVVTSVAEKGEKKGYGIVGIERMRSEKGVVVCHKMEYPYAVFYCHKMESTEAYKISMAAVDDGSRAEVAAICHKDTTDWNPKLWAFKVLKIKPGGAPVCHFVPVDHVVWVAKNHLVIQ